MFISHFKEQLALSIVLEYGHKRTWEWCRNEYWVILYEKSELTPKLFGINFWNFQTAHTSSFLIHEVSKQPAIQEKIYEEVMRINPEGATPTSEMLDSMTYIKAVVKETQR